MTVSKLPNAITENWDWQTRGACRGIDSEMFFNPDNIRGRNKRQREDAAKAICSSCPVMQQCLNWALTVNEAYGVWGGKTPEERELLSHRSARLPVAV